MFPPDRRTELPFPLNGQGTSFYTARNAIYHLLRALRFHEGDTILVPDYHHGVEVQAIRAAGASIRYYTVNRRLEPDLDEVARLCRSHPRVLYVIHFLGWPQPIEEMAALCRERGIVLIEDCALALLSKAGERPLGTFGDYAVFCLYKSLPVPDGGLLVQNEKIHADLGRLAQTTCGLTSVGGRSLELVVEWVRSRSNVLGRALGLSKNALAQLLDTLGVARSPAGTAEFDLAQVNLGMSALGRVLLKRFDYEPIRQRRRNNFLRMQNRLAGRLTPLREDLPEGTCPLFFPILVPDKRSTVRVLRQRGIGALDWWSHPASATRTEASSDSQFLRDHLLGLPIHQDVTPAQSEYIADEVLRLELRVRPAHALR